MARLDRRPAGVDQITFEAERGPGGWRQDISVDLSHTTSPRSRRQPREFKGVEQYANTRDVNDNYNKGKAQLDLKLTERAARSGLTSDEVGRRCATRSSAPSRCVSCVARTRSRSA